MILHVWETLKHKAWVAFYLWGFSLRLIWRSVVHDLSKFGSNEAPYFAEVLPRLKASTYGSDEYREMLKQIKPAIDHHNRVNSHHPEHYSDGISGMNLIDFVEMFCDWRAAVRRHEDGDIEKSIQINQERFLVDDQLASILGNSIR